MPYALVVGDPIDHSLSPVLHRAAYRDMGCDDHTYERARVPGGELARFLDALAPGCVGVSVTMPGKVEAAKIATEQCPVTRATGVANTLVPREAGGWSAHNTDAYGVATALAGVVARRALIVGSGATARSVAYALADVGVEHVTVAARNVSDAGQVAKIAGARGLDAGVTRLDAHMEPHRLVVSTLPGSALAQIARAGAPSLLRVCGDPDAFAMDVQYNPWPSGLARLRSARSGATMSGAPMLVHQAIAQVELMIGRTCSPQVMFSAIGGHTPGH